MSALRAVSPNRDHPRDIARRRILEFRQKQQKPMLTQRDIDGDGKGSEERWALQIEHSLKFRKRGLLGKLSGVLFGD